MNRNVLLYIIVPIIVATLALRALRMFFHLTHTRSVTTDVVQGILVGAALAFITVLLILPRFYVTKVKGWTINVPQEAMYWTTSKDGAGHTLSGAHDYTLHFAAGQLPPNKAFWSLTMGDAGNHFVPNPVNRYSVGDRSGLAPTRLTSTSPMSARARQAPGRATISLQGQAGKDRCQTG